MIMIENAHLTARFLALGLVILLCSAFLHAEVKGFQNRYFAEVDGSTWVLQLDPNMTFQSMITAKLQMGDTRNRYLLMGGLSKDQITGSYTPLMGSADIFRGERRFEIKRLSDNSLRLSLRDKNGEISQSLSFTANAERAPIDTAILGTWLTATEPAGSKAQPYSGQQWTIRFMDNGMLCQHRYTVDTRKTPLAQDPCLKAQEQRWKAVDGKVYTARNGNDWALEFSYRLMAGRMVVSYSGGKRVVATMAANLTLSADSR
jgi:hypothetical protein